VVLGAPKVENSTLPTMAERSLNRFKLDVRSEILDVGIKFRNLGIEEFSDFSRPGSIP
jgi:hypothetical protein